jgi:hypothetical protein
VRLAAALKANLGRRKAQARDRAADAAQSMPDTERPGHATAATPDQVQETPVRQDVREDRIPESEVRQGQVRQGQAPQAEVRQDHGRTVNES